ncbi:MAG: bacterioferritin [Leptospiraceae bacterium]|nr:bacterioferritin [Leptospiraceae bacterium]MCP5494193.1 bacterioferritin [Leptospiraceae bacterium]
MKGHQEVIDILAEVLAAELTAVNQYFIHYKLNQDWGYLKLADYMRIESISEMRHAESVIDRILYLKGTPDLQRYMKINTGSNVEEIFKHDLNLEYDAVERLNKGIPVAYNKSDNGTVELLKQILISEEEHISWIESQLQIIKDIGLANYLSQQLENDKKA